ncbi:MAG: dienelactone hydrolase family protein [Candidatus Hydrogenedentota bacterium]
MVDLSKLKSLATWPKLRGEIEEQVRAVLGTMPKNRAETQTKTVDEMDYHGYSRRRVNYFIEGWERVSGWLFIPEGKDEAPALLCCHQETPYGKDEAAGMEGDHRLAFAQHYAELGYVTLATDTLGVGERRTGSQRPFDMKNYTKENTKLSAAGKMLMDHMYALDLLDEQRRVDSARIGVIGHGIGGFNALLLAAFDERIQACVASCGFTRFAAQKDPAVWPPMPELLLAPKLRKCAEDEGIGFDWEHLLALAAPSPTLIVTSMSDTPMPSPRSCDKAVKHAARIYKLLGAPGAIDHFTHQDGYHTFTREVLEVADEWFDRWL